MVLSYDPSITAEGISPLSGSSTWNPDTYFGNTDTTNCPVTSCQKLNSGCSGVFAGSGVTVSHSAITATRAYAPGFDYTFCLSCTNGADT